MASLPFDLLRLLRSGKIIPRRHNPFAGFLLKVFSCSSRNLATLPGRVLVFLKSLCVIDACYFSRGCLAKH